MAQNHKRDDGQITVVLASGETSTSGYPFRRGSIVGIASATGVEGDEIQLYTCGVKEIPKTTGTAWTQGQPIYWNDSTSKGITTDESGFLIGFADQDYASGDTVGDVYLAEVSGADVRQRAYRTVTSSSGTGAVTVTDARVTATTHINVTPTSFTTKAGTLKVAVTAGTGYTITMVKHTDATAETGGEFTASVEVIY